MSDEPRNLPEDFYAKGDGSTPPQPAQDQTYPYQQPQYPPTHSAYGQGPYGQPAYGQQPYGQQPYGYGQPGVGAPNHPSATTSMVLGIVALAGIFFCGGFTLVLSPFAWVMGRRAVREIDAQPGRYAGRDQAKGGQVMGIIGTVLLVLGLIAIALLVIAFVAWTPMETSVDYDPGPSPAVELDSF